MNGTQHTSAAAARDVLTSSRTVAVLGAHPDAARPAHYVPAYLAQQGYRVLAVNPRFVGEQLFGSTTRATLAELNETVDIVDVFRPGAALAGHLADVLAMIPPPRTVWLQLGIDDDAVVAALLARGIDVVRNRCTLADHKSFGLGVIAAAK